MIKGFFKHLFFLVLCSSFVVEKLFSEDTLTIHPISFSTPSPEGWVAQYEVQVNFPEVENNWRKIFMVQTLKCDSSTKADKYDCGEWDYIWDAMLFVPVNDTVEAFKLGSFVTPYGKRLVMGGKRGWQWVYDLTDYAPILRGLKELHIGNNQELLDLKFYFIEGVPPRNSISISNLYPLGDYDGHYGYTYKYKDISNNAVLKPRKIDLDPLASEFSIKSIISGHGHEGPKNCCEWVSKSHYYIINDLKEHTWNIWKDCGNNPIYPQGGTWPFDRAGWCPGTKVHEEIFDFTNIVNPGQTINFDYEIEKMEDSNEGEGIYRISHQLFSYGPPNFKRNLEIVDIENPSSKNKHSRTNPTLGGAKIKIKNIGSENIRKIKFYYGLKNGKKSIFHWKGDLKFLESLNIKFPLNDWTGLKSNQSFFVEAITVNGRKDENPIDNKITSSVRIPPVFPTNFVIKLKTNNFGRSKQNSFSIHDYYDSIYYLESQFLDSTDYDVLIKLENGLYQFVFKDFNEDGIDKLWWKEKDSVGVAGALGFYDLDQNLLKVFPPDFGQEIRMDFIVGPIP